jgi:hypothetical protein
MQSSSLMIVVYNGVENMADGSNAKEASEKALSDAQTVKLDLGALPSGKAFPIETWNPPFCGDIDMRIAHDGTWFYNKTPILRPAMVKLFSKLLRKEGENYFLVTPVERVGITVEDVPFIAVEMQVEEASETHEQMLKFRTNVEDWVVADQTHPLRFETANESGFKPYVCIRSGLFARFTRSLSQDLVALGEVEQSAGVPWFGVKSSGIFFPIAPADTVFENARDLG